jgi:hypothetical protein
MTTGNPFLDLLIVASVLLFAWLATWLVSDWRAARKRKHIGFITSPFLDQWAHGEKPRANIRRGG